MESLWNGTERMPAHEPLRSSVKTDVLVIGGGMTGVLCAYMLKEAGVRCILVEAEQLGSGVTGKTTAKITSQHGLIYDKLLRRFGAEKTRMYLRSNQEALGKFRSLCQSLACGFEETDAFVYSLHDREKLEKELRALQRIGFHARFEEELPLPMRVAGAIRFPQQAQFHPLQFLAQISAGLTIYEHTPVRELIGTTAVTDSGRIMAERIIVATHFPFINKHGSYFLKMYQQRSYVLALQNAQNVHGMYIDEAKGGLSFRNYGDLLLLGGGSHRTGKRSGAWQELTEFAQRHYPKAEEQFRWATQDCMTLDDVPYVGAYSARTEKLFVATGFNKWGMTSAMASARLLTDLVQGKENPYASLYSPSRTILRPQLAANAGEAVISLLTPTVPRCPHVGCALKWNKQEHSWDCPCHGSRFAENGRLLDNPATGNLPKNK